MKQQVLSTQKKKLDYPFLSSGLPPRWTEAKKKYFKRAPERLCFVEHDQKVAGSPLWPQDKAFHPEKIEKNLAKAGAVLEKLGGKVFNGHIKLSFDRSIDSDDRVLRDSPERMSTTFVSGYLVPIKKIQNSVLGFYPVKGRIPNLRNQIKKLKGTWMLTNLGYFLTRKLILPQNKGGLDYSHNSRLPKGQHLNPNDNSYLGGFFVRQKKNSFIAYPPHFGTGGVGVDKQGRPALVQSIKLAGGTVKILGKKISWGKQDINCLVVNEQPVILYTPAYATDETTKAIATKNWKQYKAEIGANRINIVIINTGTGQHPVAKVAYVVEGLMDQSASGVVLSLEKKYFAKIFKSSGTKLKNAKVDFAFDPWFDPKIWRKLKTFYEGLMPLSQNGEHDFGMWNHPHSILTQETYIPNNLRREPRIALVQTQNFFGAIAFSGRYEYSLGISFAEMVVYIKKVFKEVAPLERIETIMSLDAGSGAKLCLVQNGKVSALNWVAAGPRNKFGDPLGNTYSMLAVKI